MSINLRFTKFIAVLSFLLVSGVQQNGVPNFALLLIYLFQFFNDISSSTSVVFWEGLISIPILGLLTAFLLSKNYRVLLFCFLLLFAVLLYITGLLNNYYRAGFTFVIPFLIFLAASVYAVLSAKRSGSLTA